MTQTTRLLRDLREATKVLTLYAVTTERHTHLRSLADELGMTVQGASEYVRRMIEEGLLQRVDGEYRATKKGVEFLHDRMLDLRRFVDRAGKEMAFIETTAAIAGTTIPRGGRVGLFMEGGVLIAHADRASPSSGVAVHDASKGGIVAVRDLEGIVELKPGRIVIARIRSERTGRRSSPSSSARRVMRQSTDFIVAALDVVGLVAARELGLKPRIEFGVLAATVEAAERGVNVVLLLSEERAADAVRAIEAANAKLEDKISYDSVALG